MWDIHSTLPLTPQNRAELRVQIPPLPPTDFGIKTRNSNLSPTFGSPDSDNHMKDSPCIPVTEMELSEDYTCVISHGPNPRTTHIFNNCVVENYYSVANNKSKTASESFLSFCHTCKKNLEQKIDIYIYRGEKAFCSSECRTGDIKKCSWMERSSLLLQEIISEYCNQNHWIRTLLPFVFTLSPADKRWKRMR